MNEVDISTWNMQKLIEFRKIIDQEIAQRQSIIELDELNSKQVIELIAEYDANARDTSKIDKIDFDKGYLTLNELNVINKWKNPTNRNKHYLEAYSNDEIVNITESAFSYSDDRSIVKSLTSIKGVSNPVASAILCFYDSENMAYMINEFHVLYIG